MLASPSNELIESMDSAQTGMNAAQQFVVVKAPLERVYEQWSRIEDLPKFVPPLRDVRVVSFESRSQEETEVTLKIRSAFDPPSLSERVEK